MKFRLETKNLCVSSKNYKILAFRAPSRGTGKDEDRTCPAIRELFAAEGRATRIRGRVHSPASIWIQSTPRWNTLGKRRIPTLSRPTCFIHRFRVSPWLAVLSFRVSTISSPRSTSISNVLSCTTHGGFKLQTFFDRNNISDENTGFISSEVGVHVTVHH